MQAVQARQDKKWIPKELSEKSFFSEFDAWHFISISDDRRCKYCEEFDGHTYYGDDLRRVFPDLEIRSDNIIDVHYHKTLWNKPTCRCKLVRSWKVEKPEGWKLLYRVLRLREGV